MAFIVPGEKYRGEKARGKYFLIGRDAAGQRRWRTVSSLEQAKEIPAERTLAEQREPRRRPVINPAITISEYAEDWLRINEARLKRRTVEIYRDTVRRHILPTANSASA
jgi:hypothetical protein